MASLTLLAVVLCLFAGVYGDYGRDTHPKYPGMPDRGNSTGYNPDGSPAGQYGQRDYVPYGAGSRDPGSSMPFADRPRSFRPGADRPGSFRPGVSNREDYEPNRFEEYAPVGTGPQGFGLGVTGPPSYKPTDYIPGRFGPNARGSGNHEPGRYNEPRAGSVPKSHYRYGSYQPQTAMWVIPEDIVASMATKTVDQDFRKPETIVFDRVITNVNGGYNNANGVFTAPVPGCYSIGYNVQTRFGSRKSAYVALTHNGVVINSAEAKGDYSTSANHAVLLLDQYDRVSLQGRVGTAIGCAIDSVCTFNIVLIKVGRFTDHKVPRAYRGGWW